ncbi:MAG: hypothetical protein QM698_09735 [Micropepsaceae bacterium]
MAKILEERRLRGVGGTIAMIVFWLFNALMLAWLIAYYAQIGATWKTIDSDAGRAGAAIGTTLGTGIIFMWWVIGAVIFGALMLATRGRKIIIEHDTDHPNAPAHYVSASGQTIKIESQAERYAAATRRSRTILAVIVGVIVVGIVWSLIRR